jgi:glycosyltransferase involved in cell wall biosynthesis
MKLLIITGIFPPDAGGPATYVPEIAAALSERGHSVKVLTLSDRTDHTDRYPFPVIRLRRSEWLPRRWLRTAVRIVREGRNADVLYVNGLQLESTLANGWLRKPLAMKVVGDLAWERARNRGWTTDGFEEFQARHHSGRVALMKWLRSWWTRRAQRVVVPSRYLARTVAGWGVPGERIEIIYNAVRAPVTRTPLKLSLSSSVKVITAGRLISAKNVEGILEAIVGIPEAGLVILGDGPERPRLESLVERLGIGSRVHFAGRRDFEETHGFLAASDLFVLNSIYEGLPHVALEAMAHGLPVVATAVGGTPEVVEDGVNGRLVPPNDPQKLREVLGEVVRNSELRRRLGEGVRQRAAAFSPTKMIEQTEALLLGLCRKGAE